MKTPQSPTAAATPSAGGSYVLQPDGTLKRHVAGELSADPQPISTVPTQKTAPAGADQE